MQPFTPPISFFDPNNAMLLQDDKTVLAHFFQIYCYNPSTVILPADAVSVFSIVVYTGDVDSAVGTSDPVYATIYGEHGQCAETLIGTSQTPNT